jgi:hypothetical protein
MAEGKSSILIYTDWIDNFESLTDEEAGRLIKHLFRYVNDQNPVAPDRLTEISFIPLKNTLKRDLKKWESEVDKKSNSGKLGNLKRWHLDLYELIIKKELTIEDAELIAQNRTKSQSIALRQNESQDIANIADSVPVSDSVTVPVIESDNEKEKPKEVLAAKAVITRKNIFSDCFTDWFLSENETPFKMQTKDFVAIASIEKYCTENKKDGYEPIEMFRFVLSKFGTLPDFYQNNKNPAFINSKFPEIIAILRQKTIKTDNQKGKQEKNNDVFASILNEINSSENGTQNGHQRSLV